MQSWTSKRKMPALIKRQLLCCDIGKQKKDKMKLDLQLVQLPDSVVPLNRFTMLSLVLLSHFVSGKYFINLCNIEHI